MRGRPRSGSNHVLRDVLVDIQGRLGRTLILVLAVAMSVGSTVAGIGLNQTTARHLADSLAANIVNQVTISRKGAPTYPETTAFTQTQLAQVRSAPLVHCAGLSITLESSDAKASRLAGGWVPPDVAVSGATSGYLCASGDQDELYPQLDVSGDVRVALVGEGAAETLGLPSSMSQGSVTVNVLGETFSVAGIIPASTGSIANTVLIPYETAVASVGSDQSSRLKLRAAPGAGARLADVAASLVSPENPSQYQVTRVDGNAAIRDEVNARFGQLMIIFGLISTALTSLIVATSMVTTIANKTPEIGLRRALGFSKLDIFRFFLAEGVLIGGAGGSLGSAVGAAVVSIASYINSWLPVHNPFILVAGTALGLVSCQIAAVVPALRASRIRPALALRVE